MLIFITFAFIVSKIRFDVTICGYTVVWLPEDKLLGHFSNLIFFKRSEQPLHSEKLEEALVW